MTKYKTRDGYSVEVVQLADTGNHDGQWLRVRYHGYYVADVRSVLELESYFPLADLEEALSNPATWFTRERQHRADGFAAAAICTSCLC